jgi:hypothetical protein
MNDQAVPPANGVVRLIWHLQDVYHEIKPCRFVFIVALIGAGIFLWFEQGIEVLRALAEPGGLTGTTGRLRLGTFAFGLLLWSLVSWYSARVLLYFDFPDTQAWHPPRGGFWHWLHQWLRCNFPRILGAAPMLIVGISFLKARNSYEEHAPTRLLIFGLIAIGGGAVLYLFFVLRRTWIERAEIGRGDATDCTGPKYAGLGQMAKETRLAVTLMLLITLVLSVIFIANPVRFGGGIGTGGVLTLAAASWVFWGSALVYLGSQDFLSPAMTAMLYPDLWQRALPFPIAWCDRGRWLEHGWENAWQNTMHNDRFSQPFLDLWKESSHSVPALFLNGTSVEVGNRIIVSPVLINPSFLEAADATGKLLPLSKHSEWRQPRVDMPLSTAAHMSARFTYVSPAGRFRPDGSHIVDGGYFENSGGATALDILRQVHDALSSQTGNAILPQVIMISNNPVGVASGSRRLAMTKQTLKTLPPSVTDEAASYRSGAFLEDLLAPVYALLSARDARGDYAQRAIGRAQEDFCSKSTAELKPPGGNAKCLYFFSLAPAKVPLPLGWMLSNGAAKAMQLEMYDQGLSAKAPVPTWNQEMLKQVVAALHGATP